MRIQLSAAQLSFDVTDESGHVVFSYATDNYKLDADLHGIVRTVFMLKDFIKTEDEADSARADEREARYQARFEAKVNARIDRTEPTTPVSSLDALWAKAETAAESAATMAANVKT